MYVDCPNFAGLWGRNSVGNVTSFVAFQCKRINHFVKHSWTVRKFMGKGYPRNPRTSIPNEQ